jgi:chlorite dismutase
MHPAELNLTTQVIGHQYCFFVTLPRGSQTGQPTRDVSSALVDELDQVTHGLVSLHDKSGHASDAEKATGCFQWLAAEPSLGSERDVAHPAITSAIAMLRLEASSDERVREIEHKLRTTLAAYGATLEVIGGVQRPRSYTSYAMTQYAYAPALQPHPASAHPFGVVTPMNKTPDWWAMDWIKRESFFLPRYDAEDKMTVRGHTLASAEAIATVVRRLVHAPGGYSQSGRYDFVGYFEFAGDNAPAFRRVMAALRDRADNPEWKYVREGPEWWGRRVATAAGAFR